MLDFPFISCLRFDVS